MELEGEESVTNGATLSRFAHPVIIFSDNTLEIFAWTVIVLSKYSPDRGEIQRKHVT